MRWDWLAPVLIAFIFVSGIIYYAHSSQECDAAGGELMRDAMGFYKCIDSEVVK